MSDVEKRLEVLGIELPVRNRKGKGAVAAVLDGEMLYVSGHLPYTESGELLYKGKVGGTLTQEEGYAAARQCGLNMLRTIKDYIGSLDRVECFVTVLGLVNSAADFSSQPAVVNGFSDLMVEVFGVRGQHARSAMGAYALNDDAPVIVDAIIKIRD